VSKLQQKLIKRVRRKNSLKCNFVAVVAVVVVVVDVVVVVVVAVISMPGVFFTRPSGLVHVEAHLSGPEFWIEK